MRCMAVSFSVMIDPPWLTRSDTPVIMHLEAHFKSRRFGTSHPVGLIVIGELARRSGLASSALRYYERGGLLSPAERTGGRRQNTVSSRERGAFIQLSPDSGLPLPGSRDLSRTGGRAARRWA